MAPDYLVGYPGRFALSLTQPRLGHGESILEVFELLG
jgi:hypothetical protein